MDHDQQFLSFIHKNAAMGVSAIPQVLSLPQSRAMGQALNSQLQEYRTIAAQSQAYARKHGARLHTPGLAVRTMSGAMLKARTAADHTTSKLAQLMIQGSTMGTVEMTRRIHQYTGKADPELLALGSRLLHTEEQNIQQMKRFLYAPPWRGTKSGRPMARPPASASEKSPPEGAPKSSVVRGRQDQIKKHYFPGHASGK